VVEVIEMKRTIQLSGGLLLVAVVVLAVALGTARAAQPQALRVPAVGFRLHADVTPVGTAKGSGHFDALLVRTGLGEVRTGLPGANVPPGVSCPPSPRMGAPCVIHTGGGGAPPFPMPPVPPTGVHWMLLWRLVLTGVTAPATATIHLGAEGAASPIMTTLCTGCQALVRGHMTVTADQAQQLLKGNGTVDVNAPSGELSGNIGVISHAFFTAPTQRTHH
jgi:hypothetical protein